MGKKYKNGEKESRTPFIKSILGASDNSNAEKIMNLFFDGTQQNCIQISCKVSAFQKEIFSYVIGV